MAKHHLFLLCTLLASVGPLLAQQNRLSEILLAKSEAEPDFDNKLPTGPGDSSGDEANYYNMIKKNPYLLPNSDLDSVESVRSGAEAAPKASGSLEGRDQGPSEEKSSDELVRTIAYNSREVRLFGPGQREVEMKDDVGTKVMIALDNLQKEASDVWGQVNEQLDKGWSELRGMVGGVLAPGKGTAGARYQRQVDPKQSLVLVSDLDGYSMADEPSSAGAQLEQAGQKIKGFFSNLGLNEANQKKASEALSKAGDSVSEAVSKDLPEALKKAGSAVSETVTKDIPDAVKNFFG